MGGDDIGQSLTVFLVLLAGGLARGEVRVGGASVRITVG